MNLCGWTVMPKSQPELYSMDGSLFLRDGSERYFWDKEAEKWERFPDSSDVLILERGVVMATCGEGA